MPSTESPNSPEAINDFPEVVILLERHGKPYRPSSKPTDEAELMQVGRLSDEGVTESREAAQEKAREILSSEKPVTFFFLGSPSEYFISGEAFGARGQATAQETARAIQNVIDEMGLTPEQANIHFFGKDEQGSRPHKNLGEPDYFYVNGSQNPTGYFDVLIEKYGPQGREEGWLSHPQELEPAREAVGAQSAPEVSERVMKLIRNIEMYAMHYARQNPGRRLVFCMATHGDVMRAVAQYGFGIGEEAVNTTYTNNEFMEIETSGHKATTKFNGKSYDINL